ncbi:MAG: hypothetical protein IJ435_01400 [Clostridia bacterium]|nr:hypothetical protein [Clostridia bacterium]
MTKKSIYITVASIVLILFGFFYNIYLCSEFNMENAANHLLIMVALLFGGIVASAILKECNVKLSEIKTTLPIYVTILIISCVIMFVLKAHNIDQTIVNSIMIAISALSGCLCIGESVDRDYALVRATFIIGSTVGLSYALCEISTTVVAAVMLGVAECFVIFKLEKNKKIWWKLHITLTAVVLAIFIGSSLLYNDVISQRLLWYFQPQTNAQFEVIKNLEWVKFTTHSNIVEFFNSEAGVVHLQIANSLGIVISLSIIIIQAILIVCMCFQIKKFLGNKKLLAICFVVPVVMQFVVGVFSSFGLMPIAEVGAMFITTTGLEFCVLPIFLFLCLSFEGHGEEVKTMLKEFIFPSLDDLDEEIKQMRLAGDSIEAILVNYDCTEDVEEIKELRERAIAYAIEFVKAIYEKKEFDDSNYIETLDRLEFLLRKYNEKYLLKDCRGLMHTSLILLYRNLSEGSKAGK